VTECYSLRKKERKKEAGRGGHEEEGGDGWVGFGTKRNQRASRSEPLTGATCVISCLKKGKLNGIKGTEGKKGEVRVQQVYLGAKGGVAGSSFPSL